MTPLQPGARVTWMHQPRGGYGFITPVAGVVLRRTGKRVLIRVARRTQGGRWEPAERWVNPDKLRPREKYVPEVDGEVAS
jgi:hypothetical protein